MKLGIYTMTQVEYKQEVVHIRYFYDATGISDDYIRRTVKTTGARMIGRGVAFEKIISSK